MSGVNDFLGHLDRLQLEQEVRSEETIHLHSRLADYRQVLAVNADNLIRLQASHADVVARHGAVARDSAASDLAAYVADREADAMEGSLASLRHAWGHYGGALREAYGARHASLVRHLREAEDGIRQTVTATAPYRDAADQQRRHAADLVTARRTFSDLRDTVEAMRAADSAPTPFRPMPWDGPEALSLLERIAEATATRS